MESKVMKSFKDGFRSKNSFSFNIDTKILLVCLAINAILSIIFASIYVKTGVRYQNNTGICIYHFVMFSVILPHLIIVARDLYLILLKITKSITEVEVRSYSNLDEIGEASYAMISNVGVLSIGKL